MTTSRTPLPVLVERVLQRKIAERALGAGIDDGLRLDAPADAHVEDHEAVVVAIGARGHHAVVRPAAIGVEHAHAVALEVDVDALIVETGDTEDAVGVAHDRREDHRQVLVHESERADLDAVHGDRGHFGRAGHAVEHDVASDGMRESERTREMRRQRRAAGAGVDDETERAFAVHHHVRHHAADAIETGRRGKQRFGIGERARPRSSGVPGARAAVFGSAKGKGRAKAASEGEQCLQGHTTICRPLPHAKQRYA